MRNKFKREMQNLKKESSGKEMFTHLIYNVCVTVFYNYDYWQIIQYDRFYYT